MQQSEDLPLQIQNGGRNPDTWFKSLEEVKTTFDPSKSRI